MPAERGRGLADATAEHERNRPDLKGQPSQRSEARGPNAIVRWLRLAIGLAVAAGFAWLLASELDVGELLSVFGTMSLAVLPVALVFMFTGWALRIVRWWWMLRQLEPAVTLGACAGPFLAAMGVNNVLPFRAGDVLRIAGFQRQLHSPALRVAGTLVIERLLDMLTLVGVFFCCLLALSEDAFPRGFVIGAGWLAGISLAAIVALLLAFPLLSRFKERVLASPSSSAPASAASPKRWQRVANEHAAHFIEALGLVRSPRSLLALTGLSVLAWGCEGATFVIVASAFQAEVAPLAPWLSMAAGTLATTIPSTPGAIGTFDYFAARGFAAFGTSLELAAAFALSVHTLLWVPATIAGLPVLLIPRRLAARAS